MSSAPKGTVSKHTGWTALRTALVIRDDFNRLDMGDLDSLAKSIADNGVEEALKVKRIEGDKFEVINGHRRVAAADIAAKKGMVDLATFEFPIFIEDKGMTDIERRAMMLRANDGKPFSAIEIATHLKALVDGGVTIADVCKQVGHSDVYVRQHLDLLAAAPEVKQALAEGKISKTLALNISTQARKGKLNAADLVAKATAGGKEAKAAAAEAADPWAAKQKALKVKVMQIKEQLETVSATVKEKMTAADTTRAALKEKVGAETYELIRQIGIESALRSLVKGAEATIAQE